jgi:anthranilate synthase component 2
MILIIDNYDSFTYNLFQYAGMIEPDIQVIRNDKIDSEGIRKLNPDHIIISPGPGYPVNAGNCISIIRELSAEYPILGICLGHQAIGEAFGSCVLRAPGGPVHGKAHTITVDNDCTMFKDLPSRMLVGRYHSLVVDRDSLSSDLMITAETDDRLIMGLKHRTRPLYGIQFHPESILTENGLQIIRNFIEKVHPS